MKKALCTTTLHVYSLHTFIYKRTTGPGDEKLRDGDDHNNTSKKQILLSFALVLVN